MVERGDGAGFLFETGAAAGVVRDIGGQDLDGDVAAQARIAGAVDLAHGARAQAGDDFIGSETGERAATSIRPA